MKTAESVSTEPPRDDQPSVHEEGLAIGTVEGGEFAPDTLEGLGRVVVPQAPEIPAFIEHMQYCRVLVISDTCTATNATLI